MAQFDPPVQINPDVPDSQKWSFVNQNFLSLSNAVQAFTTTVPSTTTTFIIAQSGFATIAGYTTSDGAQNSNTVTITHNLGYVPAYLSFKTGTSSQLLGPWEDFTLLGFNFSAGAKLAIGGIEVFTTVVTSTTIVFKTKVTLSNFGGTYTTPTYTIKYYLLTEAAN